jgi:amidohydrolase
MPAAPELRSIIRSHLPDLIRIRHDLHAHPELAYQERRTSAVVAAELTRLKIAHKAGLAGGTGVLAYIPPTNAAHESRGSIALRADMDALPILENTGKPYASKTPGTMHACGHDGHTTNLLGVARVLASLPHRPNPVTLVFQPAEEGGAGGKRMCDDGALAGTVLGPKVREIFGLHGWPQYDVGVVGSKPGPLLAATDNFVVTIRGTQSHAAYPQYSADPIVAASQIITALQTIASRNIAPQDSIVVTIAMINAGTARNIIPGHITFAGTMRTLTPETRVLGKRRFYEITESTATAMGCRAEIAWEEGYPVTFNDEHSTAKFFRIAEATFGSERVQTVPYPSLGGEDFSYYGHHVPACFFILGVRPKGHESSASLHQPEYDFNDDALESGIEMMCRLALDA